MTGCDRPGFPIQRSPDLRIFGSYPGLIAAYRVFLRLPMPRHPPSALFILVICLPKIVIVFTTNREKTMTILPFLPYSIVKEQTPWGQPDLRLDNNNNLRCWYNQTKTLTTK